MQFIALYFALCHFRLHQLQTLQLQPYVLVAKYVTSWKYPCLIYLCSHLQFSKPVGKQYMKALFFRPYKNCVSNKIFDLSKKLFYTAFACICIGCLLASGDSCQKMTSSPVEHRVPYPILKNQPFKSNEHVGIIASESFQVQTCRLSSLVSTWKPGLIACR